MQSAREGLTVLIAAIGVGVRAKDTALQNEVNGRGEKGPQMPSTSAGSVTSGRGVAFVSAMRIGTNCSYVGEQSSGIGVTD